MLTVLQKLALHLHNLGFCYIPKLPIFWDLSIPKLKYSTNLQTIPTFIFLFSLNSFMLLCTLLNISSYFLFITKPGYTLEVASMHTVASLGLIMTIFVSIIFMKHYHSFISGLNKLLQFKKQLNLLSIKFQTEQHKLSDMLLVCIVLWAIPASILIYICSLYFNFDPLYFLIQEAKLYNAQYVGTFSANLMCFILRAFAAAGGFECTRILSYMTVNLFITLNSLQRCVILIGMRTVAITRVFKVEINILKYQNLRLIYTILQPVIENILSFVISMCFVLLVVLFWIVIKSEVAKLSVIMYLLFVAIAVALVPLVFVLLTLIALLCDDCVKFTKTCKVRVDLFFVSQTATSVMSTVFRTKLFVLKMKAKDLSPIRIAYKPFLQIDRRFTIKFFGNAIFRLFDSLLLL